MKENMGNRLYRSSAIRKQSNNNPKMIKRFFLALTLFFGAFNVQAQPDSINQRVFLVGDAGELYGNTHPVLDWLKKNVNWDDEKNTVVFLGDNIYPLGLPLEGDP